jgi:GT2 family glycosyltransferase
MSFLTVIVCTHNPQRGILELVMQSLMTQSLNVKLWDLIIVDNLSQQKVSSWVDLTWHPQSKIIVEHQLGLSYGRLRGIEEASTSLIVFVDDDNVLNNEYLEESLKFHNQHPEVGCFGGKSIPQFETQPPDWFFKTSIDLGCQDYGENVCISNFKGQDFKVTSYPSFAPIGTGMVILKEAFLKYVDEAKSDIKRLALGRKGKALTSGEDNDIILTIIKHHYEIAYVPSLRITHLIPARRYSKSYLSQMAYESNRSWVKVLNMHGISIWKSTSRYMLPLRLLRVYLKLKPWKSNLNLIKFQSARGILKGQTEI